MRVVQIYYGNGQPWDDHNDIGNHRDHAQKSDRPIAALLTDLKARGLLEDTLVIWGGEFGRTPTSRGRQRPRPSQPRLHDVAGRRRRQRRHGLRRHRRVRLAGRRKPMHVHDLHATILHLMGLDHERLTYRYSGRDFRLTDVHGKVVKEIMV